MLWLILLSLSLSICANFLFGYLIYRLKAIIRMAKTAYGMMGQKSAVVRQAKKIEKGIAENLFSLEAPEVKVLMQLLPDDIKERLDEINPEVWLYLLEKYKPLIQAILQKQNPVERKEYHLP